MPLRQISFDSHNLLVGDRLKAIQGESEIGDASITAITVERGHCVYTIKTFVCQNEMRMTIGELTQFFSEALRGDRTT